MNNNYSLVLLQGMPFWRHVFSNRLAMGLALLVLFNLGFYWLAFRPLEMQEQKTTALIKALEKQVEQRSRTVAQLRSAASKIEAARSVGKDMMEKITIGRQVAFSILVSELDIAATRAGIENRDRTYDIEPIEGASRYGVVSMNANFQGDYENVVRFLNLLDRSERFFIIESLGASPRSDSTGLQVTMRIDTFVRDL